MKHPTRLALVLLALAMPPLARAEGGYTVTFIPSGTHTVAVENGRIVVDGQIVELRDESNQAIGTASMVGTEGKLVVADGTPGTLNYGTQLFSLYNTNGQAPCPSGTAISSDLQLQAGDYAEPEAYSMIVRPAEKTIGVPQHAMDEDVLLLTLSVETDPEDAINRVQEFMWYLNGEYYRSTTKDPGSKTSSLPLTYKDLKYMIGQNVYFSVKSYDGICSTKQNPVENGNNVNVDIRSGGFALSLSVDVDQLCIDPLNPENNRIELKANVVPEAAVNDIDFFYWTDNGVEMTKTSDPVLVVTQAQFPALFVPGKTAIFNVKAYDEVCAQDWVYAPGPGKQVRVVATPSIRVSVGDAAEGEDVTVTATLGYADCTGTVTVAVAGGEYVGAVEDGVASVIIPGLAAGEHEATATYSGDDKYLGTSTNCTIKVDVAQAPPSVSNVVARQRWPWNGCVDVDYEIGGYTEGLEVRISFAKQGDEGRPRVATRFLAGTEPSAVPGRHRATWDAAADGAANFVASNLVATVALVEPDVWLLPRTYELYNGDIYLDGYKVRSADDVDTNLIVAPGDSCTCLLISSYEDANGDTRYKQIEAKPAVAVESDEKDMFTTVADAGQVTVTVNDGAPIGPSAAISCSLAGCRMRNSLTVSTGAMRGIKLYLPESGRPQRYDENAWDVYARVVPFADNSREVEAGATYQKATLSNDKLDELLVRDFSYVQDGNTFVQDMYRLEASVPISAEKVLVLFELRAKNAAAGDWGFVMPAYMIDLAKPLYEEDRNYTENDYVPYDADYFFPLWTAEFNTNQTPFGTYKGNAKTKAFKVGDGVGFHTGRMTGSEGSGQGLWTIGVSHVRPLDAAVIEGGLDDGNMKAAGTGETCLLGSWYGVEGIVYPIHFTELSTNPSTFSAEPTLLRVTE